jgi:hypothetical protein
MISKERNSPLPPAYSGVSHSAWRGGAIWAEADTIFVDTTREKTMWINFELVFLQLACKGRHMPPRSTHHPTPPHPTHPPPERVGI